MKITAKKSKTSIDELVDTAYQERFLKKLLLLIIFIVLVQTVMFIFGDDLTLSIFNSLVLGGLWFSYWTLRHYSYHLSSSLVILLSLSVVLSSILTTGLGNTTIFWFFIFPIIATFLKGKRGGSIWLMILVLILTALFLAIEAGYVEAFEISYDAGTFQQLIAGVSLVALFIYFFQDSLDKKARLIEKKEKKLSKIYTQLQDEIHRREIIEESLRRNLETLKRKKARDVALLQSIGEGVIAIDKNGHVIMVNPIVEQMFNYYEGNVVGKKYSQTFNLYDEQDQLVPEGDMPLQKTLTTQSAERNEKLFYHNYNGQPVPVAINANPIFLDGEYIGAIEVFRDISEEKSIARAKDEFVSLASHQLRTPLNAIKWYAERLLKGAKFKDKEKKYLQSIHEDSARMAGLLSDYLNVSRLELKTVDLRTKLVSPEEVIKGILDDLSPIVKKKNLKVESKLESGYTMHTDEKLLEMIIQNLLSNAVKYTLEKGQITVSLTHYSGSHSRFHKGVIITVEDTGIGIPIAEQSKLFTKLFRAKNALTSEVEGTGLGLYTTKSAVDRLGGEIWFDSKPGKGTQFSVTLPNLEGNEEQIAS